MLRRLTSPLRAFLVLSVTFLVFVGSAASVQAKSYWPTKAVITSDPNVGKGYAISASYWPTLSRIESNNDPYAKASTTTASGAYQFLKAVWLELGGEWGDEKGVAFGGLKPTLGEQTDRVRVLTHRNARGLVAAGLPVNRATLYSAHFLGVKGTTRILGADLDTPITEVTTKDQREANRGVFKEGDVVRHYHRWLYKKTGDHVTAE